MRRVVSEPGRHRRQGIANVGDRQQPSRREVLGATVLAPVAGAACGLFPGSAAAAPRYTTVADWERAFLGITSDPWLPLSTSGNSDDYYNLAYGVDGYSAMFQATGKTAYLDKALGYIFNVIDDARPGTAFANSAWRDSYLGWWAVAFNEQWSKGESYLWRYVTRLLRIMKARPGLLAIARYRDAYNRILAFSGQHIFDKWYNRQGKLFPLSHIYRVNTHMSAHWAYIGLDLALLTGNVTRRQRCWLVFNNINHGPVPYYGSSLRQQLIAHPVVSGGVFWNWTWGQFGTPGSDVSHAGNVVSYIVEGVECGYEWTRDDINKLIITLNGAVWPASRTTLAQYIDGSGVGNGWLSDGWIKLGRFSGTLQDRFANHGVGRTHQFFGNGALNAAVLGRV